MKTIWKEVDLSSSKIECIAISIDDIKGATIDGLQAIDLLYLIGVKVKFWKKGEIIQSFNIN